MDKKHTKALAYDILSKFGEEHGRNIINKMKDIEKVGGDVSYDEAVELLKERLSERNKNNIEELTKVKDFQKKTPNLDFHKTGDEFVDKITKLKALKKLGSGVLKSLPIIGGTAAMMMGDNVEASVPILEDIESLNQTKEGTVDDMIENPGRYTEKERFERLKGLYNTKKDSNE